MLAEAPAAVKPRVWLVGPESAGKSTLANALAGSARAYVANFRGSTVACSEYESERFRFVDTPGIESGADWEAGRELLAQIPPEDRVLLVIPSGGMSAGLHVLLPLVKGRSGALVATFSDREPSADGILAVDARHLTPVQYDQLHGALDRPLAFPAEMRLTLNPPVERRRPRLEQLLRAALAILLILVPGVVVVQATSALAASIESDLGAFLAPIVEWAGGLSPLAAALLAGRYGLFTMTPLLFVWAGPVVVAYSAVLALYKSSGLIDFVAEALEPLLRPFGLSGRDLPRVLMGFGCNVPAVTATRACSAKGRDVCISAIAFGSVCSYQMGASLAVFAASGKAWLSLAFFAYLAVTTLAYSRWIAPKQAFRIVVPFTAAPLQWPRGRAVVREVWSSLAMFLGTAMPVFLLIGSVAAILDWAGVLVWLSGATSPFIAALGLPKTAALPVILAAIRKDGILLMADAVGREPWSAWQIVGAVYLAGVLLPCLVTALTIVRERGRSFAVRLVGRQMAAALFFTALLTWSGVVWSFAAKLAVR